MVNKAILSTLLSVGSVYSATKATPYVVTKDSSERVPITTPMKLGKGVSWQGVGDFTKHLLLTADAGIGSRCEPEYTYKNQTMKVCIELKSSQYLWDRKKTIARNVICTNPPCKVPSTERVSVGRGYSADYNGVEGDKGRYYLPNSNTFLPKNVINSGATLNNEIPFQINEKTQESKKLWFRALTWEAKITMTTTVTSPSKEPKNYVSKGTMTYPVILPSDTLDGVYGLE